ncbi:hypothetical protein [Psychroflexus planctonicus]|uniref:Uncharacterized protein n=1 Tax=Psychroflexus planctonicus TaxID=1526575 RepID=A0ABQ1SCI6_9FLAO|nr:hypothetical protein [Psychroflexus planctonicus]GGE28087.1 hypothetical protein GCM10010832_06020 [Psychroflexus planctonicus]
MKNTLLLSLIFVANLYSVTAQETYTLYLNGEAHEIELNENYTKKIGKEEIEFQLKAKDTLYYEDELMRFAYLRLNPISKVELDETIDQIMMMTAEGTGVIVQKYLSINPIFLNEMMLNEVTKESLNYGFDLKRDEYQKTLKSGQTLTVQNATLTYKDEVNIYEVATIGGNDQGIMVMTIAMDNNPDTMGKQLINLLWSTLEYKD